MLREGRSRSKGGGRGAPGVKRYAINRTLGPMGEGAGPNQDLFNAAMQTGAFEPSQSGFIDGTNQPVFGAYLDTASERIEKLVGDCVCGFEGRLTFGECVAELLWLVGEAYHPPLPFEPPPDVKRHHTKAMYTVGYWARAQAQKQIDGSYECFAWAVDSRSAFPNLEVYASLDECPEVGDEAVDKMYFPVMPEEWTHGATPEWQQRVRRPKPQSAPYCPRCRIRPLVLVVAPSQCLGGLAQALSLLSAIFDAALLPAMYVKRVEDFVVDFRVQQDERLPGTQSAVALYPSEMPPPAIPKAGFDPNNPSAYGAALEARIHLVAKSVYALRDAVVDLRRDEFPWLSEMVAPSDWVIDFGRFVTKPVGDKAVAKKRAKAQKMWGESAGQVLGDHVVRRSTSACSVPYLPFPPRPSHLL